jgi:hypothetical protein
MSTIDARIVSPMRQGLRIDGMDVSHRSDADSSPGIREVEIETEALRRTRARHRGRFLKGPIPFRQLAAAARLPGQALALFLAAHHQTALTRRTMVTLPSGLLTELGISRDAKARGLRQLEDAGLIRVERSIGRAARVGLITAPTTMTSPTPPSSSLPPASC